MATFGSKRDLLFLNYLSLWGVIEVAPEKIQHQICSKPDKEHCRCKGDPDERKLCHANIQSLFPFG